MAGEMGADLVEPTGVEADLHEAQRIALRARQVSHRAELRESLEAPGDGHTLPRPRPADHLEGSVQLLACMCYTPLAQADVSLGDSARCEAQLGPIVATVGPCTEQDSRRVAVQPMDDPVLAQRVECNRAGGPPTLSDPVLQTTAASYHFVPPVAALLGVLHDNNPARRLRQRIEGAAAEQHAWPAVASAPHALAGNSLLDSTSGLGTVQRGCHCVKSRCSGIKCSLAQCLHGRKGLHQREEHDWGQGAF
mmetsp:Transcript_20372/g.56273  ORF Transcript_20372/g.56273 Transcript_20372/m.56273 type:complete len:250 (+) Transcript_20372:236-985(+)